jgi:PTS system nitrogen regulatory IIA component
MCAMLTFLNSVFGGRLIQNAYDDKQSSRRVGPSPTRREPQQGPFMNSVSQLLSADDILLDLEVTDAANLFEAVGQLFEQRHGVSAQMVVDKLSARELLGSTGLGKGVALPHARIKKLPKAMAAFVRLKTPIEFAAPDAKPVSFLLVLLVPERATEQHLQILAEFAQMLCDRHLREGIEACEDSASVARLFFDWSPP